MALDPEPAPISLGGSLILFLVPSGIFVALTYGALPWISKRLGLHPLLAWYITGGLGMFLPLFALAICLLKRDGYPLTGPAVIRRLRLGKPSCEDWRWALWGLLSVTFLTGVVLGSWQLLAGTVGIRPIRFSAPFLDLGGAPRPPAWFLAAWLPFWALNILGEELLWRGYILPRQLAAHGGAGWLLNAALWICFHICFGRDLIIILLPLLVILPYVVSRRQNTWLGIAMHGTINGIPSLLIATGLLK